MNFRHRLILLLSLLSLALTGRTQPAQWIASAGVVWGQNSRVTSDASLGLGWQF